MVRVLAPDAKKRDLEDRMIEGFYVGHASRSGTVLALTEMGVIKGAGVRRYPMEQRWPQNMEIEQLKGVPWDWKEKVPQGGGVRQPVLAPTASDAADYEVKAKKVLKRKLYVTRRDIDRFGATDGCPGCTSLVVGGSAMTAHSSECRARISKELEEKGDPRWQGYVDRVAEGDRVRDEGESS